MNEYLILFYICQAAGIIMIGGGIWLIMKEKIYLDSTTKQAVQIEIPLFGKLGKLHTNVPALGLFFFGIVPLVYPIEKLPKENLTTRYLQVEQDLSSDDHPVGVYVVVFSKYAPPGWQVQSFGSNHR